MSEEVFNPDGHAGEPLGSVDDAIEATACVGLATWLTQNRPNVLAVEVDGTSGDLLCINILAVASPESCLTPCDEEDDPVLWERARESWELLASVARTGRRVIASDEERGWLRGWP